MDNLIEESAKKYAKEEVFKNRLLINIIGIAVLITMIVSKIIAA